MKDAYSCDLDDAGLDVSYQAQYDAYVRIFERLGLKTIAVSGDVGIMGGSRAHEFMVLNPAGEDVLVLCEACGYAANRQVARDRACRRRRPRSPARSRTSRRPGRRRSRPSPAFLDIPEARTAKAAFFVAGDGRLVTAIVRGDSRSTRRSSSTRSGASTGLRPATVDEIKAAGHGARLRVADRRPRHGRRRRRARRPLAEPRRRREPRRVPLAERQRRARLHAGRHRGHRRTPARATLPRPAASP